MDLEIKSAVTGVKVLDEGQGIVQAIVSVTNIVDQVNDNILPGAFEKTLTKRMPKGLRHHDWNRMVAKTLYAEELRPGDRRIPEISRKIAAAGGGGLLIRGQYNLKTQMGRDAYEDMKFFGDDAEFSVGYKVPRGKSSIVPRTGTRQIKEMDLYEWSDVAFGAAPLTAGTVSFKSYDALEVKALFIELVENGELTPDEIKAFSDLWIEEGCEGGLGCGLSDVLPDVTDTLAKVMEKRYGGLEACCESCGTKHSPATPVEPTAPADPRGVLDVLEEKVDKVATEKGVKKYDAPIGTPIVAGRAVQAAKKGKKKPPSLGDRLVKRQEANKKRQASSNDALRKAGAKPPDTPGTDFTPEELEAGKAVAAKWKLSPEGLAANEELNPGFPGLSRMGPPDVVTDDVDEALAALADGKNVELNQPDKVATLLNRLQQIVADAKAKGEKAPDYNLCQVSVTGSNLFCAEHKGETRITMPQLTGVPLPGSNAEKLLAEINADKRAAWLKDGKDPAEFKPDIEANISGQFREFLKSEGLTTKVISAKASNLHATQRELVGANVAGMMSSLANTNADGSAKAPGRTFVPGAIFVSANDYVIDGHHTWAAKVGLDTMDNELGDIEMQIEKVNVNIETLLAKTVEWTTMMGIPPKGGGKGSGAAAVAAQEAKSADDDLELADYLGSMNDDEWGAVIDSLHGSDLQAVKDINDLVDLEFKDRPDAWEGDYRAAHLAAWFDRTDDPTIPDDELVTAGMTDVEVKVSSRALPGLDRKPGKSNWVDHAGGLPDYIERIAKHLVAERGMTISHAIATAINRVKKWASGVGDVKPDTRAKAAKAVAQWEAMKAKNKARSVAKDGKKDDRVDLESKGHDDMATDLGDLDLDFDDIFPGLDLKAKKHRFMGKDGKCGICKLTKEAGAHIGASESTSEDPDAKKDRDDADDEKDDDGKKKWVPPWKKSLDQMTEHDVAEMKTLVAEWEEKAGVYDQDEDDEDEDTAEAGDPPEDGLTDDEKAAGGQSANDPSEAGQMDEGLTAPGPADTPEGEVGTDTDTPAEPTATKSDDEELETKAGRMLSSKNAMAIKSALDQLVTVLTRAGVCAEGDEAGPKEEKAQVIELDENGEAEITIGSGRRSEDGMALPDDAPAEELGDGDDLVHLSLADLMEAAELRLTSNI